jgi:tetratricopeptide (TPR) repeat protein
MPRRLSGRVRTTGVLLPAILAVLSLWAGCGEDPPPRLVEPESELSTAEAWTALYDEIDHHHLDRARGVFAKMREATGVRAELRLLDMGRAPRALALPDRSILLSASALDFCYEGVTPDEGDARLAFVLGHELCHIGSDDFWHASAFNTLRHADGEDESVERLRELMRQDGRNRQVLELKADEAGMLAVAQAGYDPALLLTDGQTFFEAWTGGTEGTVVYEDPSHPTSIERAASLRLRLLDVLKELPRFEAGVAALDAADRLAAEGDPVQRVQVEEHLRSAIGHFRAFGATFEGREVLNNLAVAHLRLATLGIARCGGERLTRYHLPGIVDPVTLATRFRPRAGSNDTDCIDRAAGADLESATGLLETAIDRDPAYRPARQNLLAALLLAGVDSATAVAHAERLRDLAPEDPVALVGYPLAILSWAETGVDWIDVSSALANLEDLRRRFPENLTIAYDRAAALTRHGEWGDAQTAWREFLELQPEGPWAAIALSYVGETGTGGSDQ